MMTADRRPPWLVHADRPAPITIEAWSVEARALGFDDIEAGHLCFWRWVASLDPERIARREPNHGPDAEV